MQSSVTLSVTQYFSMSENQRVTNHNVMILNCWVQLLESHQLFCELGSYIADRQGTEFLARFNQTEEHPSPSGPSEEDSETLEEDEEDEEDD